MCKTREASAWGGGWGFGGLLGALQAVPQALEARERILYFHCNRVCKLFCKRYVRERSHYFHVVRVGYCSVNAKIASTLLDYNTKQYNTITYYS